MGIKSYTKDLITISFFLFVMTSCNSKGGGGGGGGGQTSSGVTASAFSGTTSNEPASVKSQEQALTLSSKILSSISAERNLLTQTQTLPQIDQEEMDVIVDDSKLVVAVGGIEALTESKELINCSLESSIENCQNLAGVAK